MKVEFEGDILRRTHEDGKQDVLLIPPTFDAKAKRREAVLNLWSKLTGVARTVYVRYNEEQVFYEITPTSSVRNNQAYLVAKVVASFYRKPSERRDWGLPWKGGLLKEQLPHRVSFRIVMKNDDVAFYLIMPREKAGEILRKAEAIYDSGITIKEVESIPSLDPSKSFCTELKYRRHDMFSLATDRDNNYPLPSLLTAVRTMDGDDIAIFDAMLEPYDRMEWYKEAKDAHNILENGYVPRSGATSKLLRMVNDLFNKVRMEILEMTRFTKGQQDAMEQWKQKEGQTQEATYLLDSMEAPTRKKKEDDIVRTYLRIAVQSDDKRRAKDTAYTLANAWKDISGDNELERVDVPEKWNTKYLKSIEEQKGFYISFKPPKMSVYEAGKLLQLPGHTMIEEFPQIRNRSMREVSLPNELNIEGIKSIRLGYVTERGERKLARIPLEGYTFNGDGGREITVQQKAVYDAVCTSHFGQGKQGSGKSEGFGVVMAYDMVMAGFTTIIVDTADGEVLRKFVNSLPEDFPEEKIHALNMDNKALPIALDWADVYGRKFTGGDADEELQALEISERLTQRFVGFINSRKDSGELFSDRMHQYVVSAMRAITTKEVWSFLDLELALTSPTYREELLANPQVQDQADVYRDLMTLQDKAVEGKDRAIVDPIITRVKELSSTQFMANLFFQEPKLDSNGKPVLDLRKIMDNEEGGYGHVVVIQASYDAWQENQESILTFFEDKINFNAFSRIDIPQDKRKPVLKWIDEPHKIIKGIEDRLAGTTVEFRKYRIKNLFTGHSIDQMGGASDALLDGGAQITSYKTERLSELQRFSHSFKPYDDYKKLYEALPDKHVAINKVRLPSGMDAPAFIAEMVKPPGFVKDRTHVWDESSKRYGRPWKEVRDSIQTRRNRYQQTDVVWLEEQQALLKASKSKKALPKDDN